MRRFLIALIMATPLVDLQLARAADVELKNDSFGGGGSANAGAMFIPGEIAASRFDPPVPGTQLRKVRLLFLSPDMSMVPHDITLHVWDDSGLMTIPGTEIYTGDFTLTPSTSAINEIDLTTVPEAPINVPGTFRVGIEFPYTTPPTVALDDDGPMPGKNFIFAMPIGGGAGTWYPFESPLIGGTGDWILRAVVAGGGTTPDAGPGAPDAGPGAPDAGPGAPDAGSGGGCLSPADCPIGQYCGPSHVCTFDCRVNSDCAGGDTCNSLGMCVAPGGNGKSGCGCNVSSRSGAAGAGAGVLLFGLMLAARRRRRQ